MIEHDPIDALERQLWERFTGPPGHSGGPAGPGACLSVLELSAYLDGRLP